MVLFLLLYLTLYSFLHVYLYRKVSPLLGRYLRPAFGVFSLYMILSPFLWRYLDKEGLHTASYYVALSGLLWMGYVVYFFLTGLTVDLVSKLKPLPVERRVSLTLVLSAVLSAYSHLETYYLQVYRFVINTPKLPEGEEIKILHISDLHLGPVMGEDRIDMVLEVYEREKPDMVVATGDMVDGNMRGKDHLADLLRAVNPPLGKYAVLGNHEFYRGPEQAVEFLERAGFEVLRCGWVNVGDHIVVAGVDDPAGNGCDEEKALKGVDPSRFVILLKHRPSVRRETLPLIDLQLSGHSHGGVLFFVGLTVLRVLYETDRGIREVAPGKFIVVSKGVGTGGPPMRLLSPPDVAVITLYCKGSCKPP
ncbi:MAG: metallophosphoesterase [Aquificota bacterium]|nr:metallophosphoesterase [Aquificota bacterium]